VVKRATEAVGDLPIRDAVSRPRALAQLMAGRHSAHTTCRRRTEKSPILWQAGMLLTITGTVGSLCNVTCAISDGADWIRASPEDVLAPVAVASSA
jgi:hypothetical protein